LVVPAGREVVVDEYGFFRLGTELTAHRGDSDGRR
jgi:hypothetical protein